MINLGRSLQTNASERPTTVGQNQLADKVETAFHASNIGE